MDIFISWSGPRSEAVANALRKWLPLIVNAFNPWLSSADIDKGARWGTDIASRLEAAKAGIICLTPSNFHSDWVLFEAGALSKTVSNTYVCTLFIGLEPSDIKGPLAQFQATRANKVDLLKLVKTLNKALGDHAVDESQVEEAFEALWPKLESELTKIPADESSAAPERSQHDLLVEILNYVRNQSRSLGALITEQDREALLISRVGKAIGATGIANSWSGGVDRAQNKLLYRVVRKDGGGVLEVAVPVDTALEAIEEMVRAQITLQQPVLPLSALSAPGAGVQTPASSTGAPDPHGLAR